MIGSIDTLTTYECQMKASNVFTNSKTEMTAHIR